jgi:cytochrome c5
LWLVVATATAVAHAQDGKATGVSDPHLQRGRNIWVGTCRDCHANPLSDAPQVKDRAAWNARIARGRGALVLSALNGRSGPNADMPPRGGNTALSDDDVRAAVDYILYLVSNPTRKEAP